MFEFPYLAHAAMEPMNAVAWHHDDVIEVWGGHQMPDLYQATAAKIAGVPPDKVKLHVMMTGGSFGRRATPDSDVIAEAVETAKAIGWKAPVKVQWTREDDMAGGRYRPVYAHHVEGVVDGTGKIAAWRQRIVGQSIMRGTPFSAFIRNGVDPTSVEGASTLPYAIPNMRVELVTPDVGVPVLWWRSVGSSHTAYATEVFLDELAHAAGQDPFELRRGAAQGQAAPPPRARARGREGRLGQADGAGPGARHRGPRVVRARPSPRSPRSRSTTRAASRSSASSAPSTAGSRSTPTS